MIFTLLALANFNCSFFISKLLVTTINFTFDLTAYSMILYLLPVISISFSFKATSLIKVVERYPGIISLPLIRLSYLRIFSPSIAERIFL